MAPAEYDPSFFSCIGSGSAASARRIVPLLLALPGVRSVVDVGCGTGEWLAVFAALGVEDYLGLDGGTIGPNDLSIRVDRFLSCDLERDVLNLDRRFDLAISLEVAEHLEARFANGFVDRLTGLSPVVAFSAAVPGQRGVNHVNLQWPDYWADLFAARGYKMIDAFRRQVWDDPSVEPWYKQNLFLYVANDHLERFAALGQTGGMPLRVVHPDLFAAALDTPSLREVMKKLPSVLSLTFSERWAKRRLNDR